MPSELTVSQSLDTLSPQSKPEDRRKVTHNMSHMSTDVRPRPPRRKHSDKEFSVASLSKSLVPKQIQCFPMDESPMKPSRQVSVSKLLDGSARRHLLQRCRRLIYHLRNQNVTIQENRSILSLLIMCNPVYRLIRYHKNHNGKNRLRQWRVLLVQLSKQPSPTQRASQIRRYEKSIAPKVSYSQCYPL